MKIDVRNNKILKDLQKNKYLQLFPDFKQEKVKKVTSFALTLVALSFFGLFAINPTLSTITKLRKELDDDKYTDQQLQNKINNLSNLQQEYSLIQKDLTDIYSAIPDTPDSAKFIAQIKAIGAQSGMTIEQIQIYQVEMNPKPADFFSYNFSVSGQGNYDQILNFISLVNKTKRITTQDSISIFHNQSDDIYSPLRLTFRGNVYFKK